MIPKTLHYCWFGAATKPASFERCLQSWKRFCPDYDIVEWNEQNYAPFQNQFIQDALRKRSYAFAADALRVEILWAQGGIYLDTDMLLLKPLEALLTYDFFTGYEVEGRPAYGLFGAVPGHPIVEKMCAFYRGRRFDVFSPPVITHAFKEVVHQSNLGARDIILEPSVFYPLPYEHRGEDYQSFVQEDTLAVHLWDHSWKKAKENRFWDHLKKIRTVAVDTLFYGYPWAYWKRYTKEFARKAYHQLKRS